MKNHYCPACNWVGECVGGNSIGQVDHLDSCSKRPSTSLQHLYLGYFGFIFVKQEEMQTSHPSFFMSVVFSHWRPHQHVLLHWSSYSASLFTCRHFHVFSHLRATCSISSTVSSFSLGFPLTSPRLISTLSIFSQSEKITGFTPR